MEIVFTAIGIIHSPYVEKESTPIQPTRSTAISQVEVYPEFAAGLADLEEFSHIFLLYHFHRSSGYQLAVRPFLDSIARGLFSTRYPCRPNQIGLSIVELIARQGNILEIRGVDVLDGTPLLDIKPYVPKFDAVKALSTGWLEKNARKSETIRSDGRFVKEEG